MKLNHQTTTSDAVKRSVGRWRRRVAVLPLLTDGLALFGRGGADVLQQPADLHRIGAREPDLELLRFDLL